MSVSLSESTVDRLRTMPERAFGDVIELYLRGEAPADVAAALEGPLADRTRHKLRAMIRSVNTQLQSRRAEQRSWEAKLRQKKVSPAEFDDHSERYYSWQASVIRFRERLEAGYADLRLLQRTSRAEQLEQAIASHRSARLSGNGVDTFDRRLWAVLGDDT